MYAVSFILLSALSQLPSSLGCPGCGEDPSPDERIVKYTEVLRKNPNDSAAYHVRGSAWFLKREYDKAIDDYNAALRLDPKNCYTLEYRGLAFSRKGELRKAMADFDECLRIDPSYTDAYLRRGNAWRLQGEFKKAIDDYQRAIQIYRDWPYAYNALAWLAATCPDPAFRDGAKSVAQATKGCELSRWKEWFCIATLAAGYAESGDFKQAVAWQQKALDMAKDEYDKERARAALKLYQAGKPFREQLVHKQP